MSTNNDATTIDTVFQNDFSLGYNVSNIAERFRHAARAATQSVKGAIGKAANMYNEFTNGDFLSEIRERDFARQYAIDQSCEQYEKIRYNQTTGNYEFA